MNIFLSEKALASDSLEKACSLLNKVEKAIIDPIILLLFTVAIVYFFAGIIKFINNVENPTEKEIGKQNMIWGVVGMTIMVSVFAILSLISGFTGGMLKNC